MGVRELKIGNHIISDDSSAFIIAEIGHNHQGNLETAFQLIRAAADSGATAAKFQKRDNRSLFTPKAFNKPYNSENSFGTTYGEHREALELDRDAYMACIEEAKKSGILFFATAFDRVSAAFLENLDVPLYKIASGDLQNLPLISHIAEFGKPMIISTGGGTTEMIDEAVETIRRYHNNFAILQCTASYPADFGILNLKVIETLRARYPENIVGYSGHDNGIAMAIAAYALGARIIEKHFTLNRAMKGTDHAFSLEPVGMKKMVRDLQRTKSALGDGIKQVYEIEMGAIKKMGKMIVAARDLIPGEVITTAEIEFRSPAEGLPPSAIHLIYGKVVAKKISWMDPIRFEDLEM